MSQSQLSIFAEAQPIPVEPTRRVLVFGARSPDVPAHSWDSIPAPASASASAGLDPEWWARVLEVGEDLCRFSSAPRVVPGFVDVPHTVGGSGLLSYSSAGFTELERQAKVGWGPVLRALRALRDQEPAIARARDLAQGYHYLDYYSRAYPDPADSERVCAVIRAAVLELGGDPTLVPTDDEAGP